MARIRTIKPEFWANEQVMDCSPMARLLFIGLWNFCDDGGNHPASAKTIKAEIFPGDDITSTTVQQLLAELESNGLIALYSASGKDFWHVTGWHHQKIDKKSFKYPAFDGAGSEQIRLPLGDSSPPEVDVEGKGKGREKEGEGKKVVAEAPTIPDWIPAKPWADFIRMRVEKKKAPTGRAVELLIAELAKLLQAGQNLTDVLDKSTRNGWLDVFAIKPQANGARPSANDLDAINAEANREAKRLLFGEPAGGTIDA